MTSTMHEGERSMRTISTQDRPSLWRGESQSDLDGAPQALKVERSARNGRSDDTYRQPVGPLRYSKTYDSVADVVLFAGRCEDLLASMPDGSAQLIVTSPPYNIGKAYERRTLLSHYVQGQRAVIEQSVRVLAVGGSICWQVGNHVDQGEVFPLDIILYSAFKALGLKLRNRIIWHFEHGLHTSRRFSGRHEAILWFTKGEPYCFNLDSVRVPQKYPNKRAFKGPKAGLLSGNPLGKNPGDVWVIPNVKSNHVEKTAHPCQFPVELVERRVLALSKPGDAVLDPYGGVGSSVVAAVLHQRRGIMAEVVPEYLATASNRIALAERGELRTRPRTRPVFEPAEEPLSLGAGKDHFDRCGNAGADSPGPR